MPPALVRAVLDTNLIVRGFLRRRPQSTAVRLFDAMLDGAFENVVSPYLLGEVRKTLSDPAVRETRLLSSLEIEAFVGSLRDISVLVPGAYQDLNVVKTDPNDDPIVASALEAGAGYIVTADRRDLLPLKVIRISGHTPVQVLPPGPFLRQVLRSTRT